MRAYSIIIGILIGIGFAGHCEYKLEKDRIAEEFRVWTKATSNPNGLSLEEFITYKGIK